MYKTLIILSIGFAFASCRTIVFNQYKYPEDPISYRRLGQEVIRAFDTITHIPYRDVVLIDTVLTVQAPQHIAYKFNFNHKCIYSFMSNGGDSGPIDYQYKGKYKVHGDSIKIKFIASRSISSSAKHNSNMKIEDRPWREMKLYNQYEQSFLISNKQDTIWHIQESGLKSIYLIKR